MGEILLELRDMRKQFGSLVANDKVNLQLHTGEIHALLGENGAGKSTLVKMLCGMLRPDAGTHVWRGKQVKLTSPAQAQRLGIGVVFQHFSIFRALTVAENIALGLPSMSQQQLLLELATVTERYGLELEPQRPMYTLSVGEWQRVEIVRRLLGAPKLLVLDEPTSVLTPQEAELLFVTLRKLVAEGCAVLYISHRLTEIQALCDKATIMRAGKVVYACDPRKETSASLAELMIGQKPAVPQRRARAQTGEQVDLIIKGLCLAPQVPNGPRLQDINLDVCGRRITAIAGIAGNGQSEFAAVLGGDVLVAAQTVRINDEAIGALSPQARRRRGLHYVPEERFGHAAVAEMPLWENVCLTARHSHGIMRAGMLSRTAASKFSSEIINKFDVRCGGVSALSRSLSGGNLQKFILGRELTQVPRVLVINQPTWGVDAGACALIHQMLLDLAASGAAVLVISQDLSEIFTLADDIAVICEGRLSELVPVASLTPSEIGLLMGGVHGSTCAAA